ncbi:acyl--CoA ligase [Nocardia uniformis]|uniref:Acyl--CoA ligase n=1 Tax=Nocardia uniformis TaxID=53432 RepID=A0A849CBV9_9NOCA|nr:class I adenylate-forming enzyme family protein [Nocardia uniformis]NNH70451.1 acyl--CoA ligase [Nocardia uniformis]
MTFVAERTLTESYWACDDSVPLSEHTVGSLLADRGEHHGDTVALVGTPHGTTELRRLTYRQLYDEALRVATALTAITEPGDFVALWAPNVVEWPIIEFGAALAGRVLVAINPAFRQHELAYVLDHSGAKVLIHADDNKGYDMAGVAAAAVDQVPAVEHRISLSDRGRWQAVSCSADDEFGPYASDPDAPVMLQYTSGTTGNPKGVLLRHRSLVNVAKMTMVAAEIAEGSVFVNPLPMFHTAACVIGTLGPVWQAGTALLVETFAPADVLAWAKTEQAQVLFFVPPVLGALLEAVRGKEATAPRFTSIVGGAANVPQVLIEGSARVFGAAVHNLFGQTELAPVLTLTRKSDSIEDQLTTVGRPVAQVEAKIAGADGSGVAALRTEGEICARGYQQMIEYYRDPETTAATVDADGWLHTGDLGSMDSRGFITLTGRLKDMIISGGENIAPAEVESRLVEHDSVRQAAVVGVPHDKWGETVAAVLVLRGEQPEDLVESVKHHLSDRLAPFKTPRRWFVATGLPTTPSGKVQKFKLREAILDDAVDEIG